jgi:hypothetical protein
LTTGSLANHRHILTRCVRTYLRTFQGSSVNNPCHDRSAETTRDIIRQYALDVWVISASVVSYRIHVDRLRVKMWQTTVTVTDEQLDRRMEEDKLN